jgi:hypothetical protein
VKNSTNSWDLLHGYMNTPETSTLNGCHGSKHAFNSFHVPLSRGICNLSGHRHIGWNLGPVVLDAPTNNAAKDSNDLRASKKQMLGA